MEVLGTGITIVVIVFQASVGCLAFLEQFRVRHKKPRTTLDIMTIHKYARILTLQHGLDLGSFHFLFFKFSLG